MANKPWSMGDERYIRDNAGAVPVREMARKLDRTEQAVRIHAHDMRTAGRLTASLRPIRGEVNFQPQTRTCALCGCRRTTCDRNGICKVCRDKDLLERHMERMAREWRNLPQELRDRTENSFNIERSPHLMKYPFERPKHPQPLRDGAFWEQAAKEDYAIAMEAYELRRIHLDIDAAKQRVSKWKRKKRAYEEAHHGGKR